jgi:hypothetical protein
VPSTSRPRHCGCRGRVAPCVPTALCRVAAAAGRASLGCRDASTTSGRAAHAGHTAPPVGGSVVPPVGAMARKSSSGCLLLWSSGVGSLLHQRRRGAASLCRVSPPHHYRSEESWPPLGRLVSGGNTSFWGWWRPNIPPLPRSESHHRLGQPVTPVTPQISN